MSDINALRRRILETAFHAREGHLPSSLSILEIVWTLYDKVLTAPPDYTISHQGKPSRTAITPSNWQECGADQFVLSKAHGSLALYAVLESKGFIAADDMDAFCQPGGLLGGHPGPNVPGMFGACGSLGHGLGMAVGMAYAKKLRKEAGRVYCLVGDGELQEGSCAEAARLSSGLPLTIIVDANGSHTFDPAPLWNWIVVHAADRLAEAEVRPDTGDVHTFIVQTTKGAGIPEMERDPAAWHRKIPSPQQYREMMEGLGE